MHINNDICLANNTLCKFPPPMFNTFFNLKVRYNRYVSHYLPEETVGCSTLIYEFKRKSLWCCNKIKMMWPLWQPLLEWFEIWIWPANSWCPLRHGCSIGHGHKRLMAPAKCIKRHPIGNSITYHLMNIYIQLGNGLYNITWRSPFSQHVRTAGFAVHYVSKSHI